MQPDLNPGHWAVEPSLFNQPDTAWRSALLLQVLTRLQPLKSPLGGPRELSPVPGSRQTFRNLSLSPQNHLIPLYPPKHFYKAEPILPHIPPSPRSKGSPLSCWPLTQGTSHTCLSSGQRPSSMAWLRRPPGPGRVTPLQPTELQSASQTNCPLHCRAFSHAVGLSHKHPYGRYVLSLIASLTTAPLSMLLWA